MSNADKGFRLMDKEKEIASKGGQASGHSKEHDHNNKPRS